MCVMLLAVSTPSGAELAGALSKDVVSGRLELDAGRVVARDSGAVIELSPGVRLHVAPGTRMLAVHRRERLWLGAAERTLTDVVVLESGHVDVECADPARAVLVRAPLEVNGIVQSGKMTVSARDAGVSVANREGKVSWAVGSWKFEPVSRSQIKTFTSAGRSESTLLPAPVLRLQQDLLDGLGGAAELAGLEFRSVPHALAYRVQIEQLEPERRVALSLTTRAPLLSARPRLTPGRYRASVRAIDGSSVEGQASAAQDFSVVGVRTSSGARVDANGTIVAGADRRVQLTFASDLVMKDGLLDWRPVPDEIVLSSMQPKILSLRRPSDERTLTLRVMAQQFKALVSVGPQRARWPGDDLRLEVRILGLDGERAPSWVEPRFRVLLGIDVLNVTWRRDGDKFLADVPARGGLGPWVVRVEVRDQHDYPLGRDFVEIAPRAVPDPMVPAQATR
jgi:hypothetical protein